MGELALDGSLLPTFGTLAMSLAGLETNYYTIYTSVEKGNNLKAITNHTIYGESSLENIITILENQVKSKSISTSQKVKIGKNQDEILTNTMDNKNNSTTYDVDY